MPKDVILRNTRGARNARYALDRSTFVNPAAEAAIEAAVAETLAWLRGNEQTIVADGHYRNAGWYDAARFGDALPEDWPVARVAMAIAERHHLLSAKIYGQGIAYFVTRLIDHGLIDGDPEDVKTLVFLRSGETRAWVRALVRDTWSGASMSLKEFRDIGDFFPFTPQSKAHTKLLKLSSLGLALVSKPDGRKDFAIAAGPVAKAFYENVWYPVLTELTPDIPTGPEV